MKGVNKNRIFLPNVKITNAQLLFVSLVAIASILLIKLTTVKEPQNLYDKMVSASSKMKEAEKVLNAYRKKNNIEIDSQHDPLNSGFIGIEFSPITTTLGDLKAKQTSTNPDFAALFIHWFDLLKLHSGDKIIIHASSSFPALSIASIIASEVYGLEPIIMSSIGASSFGANIPQLTYWDIESILFENGIIQHKTIYATAGGQDDNGSSFWENGFEIMEKSSKRNSQKIYLPKDLQTAIRSKLDFIESQKPFSLFINIGGNQAALGNVPCSMELPHGLIIEALNVNAHQDCFGLIHWLNQKGTPIIQMLNIRDIALENGIELLPNNSIGISALYFKQKKSKLLIFPLLIILIFILLYRNSIIKSNKWDK